MTGKITLVGVGPGDPELLTLKAVREIKSADLLVYPQKPGEKSLALTTVAQAQGFQDLISHLDLFHRIR